MAEQYDGPEDENIALQLANSLRDEHGTARAIGLLDMAKGMLDFQIALLLQHTIKVKADKLAAKDKEAAHV